MLRRKNDQVNKGELARVATCVACCVVYWCGQGCLLRWVGKYQWIWATTGDLSKLLGMPFGSKLRCRPIFVECCEMQNQILELHKLVTWWAYPHHQANLDVIPHVLFCGVGKKNESFIPQLPLVLIGKHN